MFPTTSRFLGIPASVDPDCELIHRFATTRDEDAFAELVRRHGGLVRGVAHRVLADPHTADDVFQAAFLLLASKAIQENWGRTVGPWLYQVTCRLAYKARARRTRRREQPLPPLELAAPAADPCTPLAWAEVRAALDEELAYLPVRQRDPLVLCYLEGLTRDEAAVALGCSVGEIKGRLERGRKTLQSRLERRGLALSTGLAAVLVADPGVSVKAASGVAQLASRRAAGEAIPAAIRDLLRGTWVGFGLKATAMAAVLVVAGFSATLMTTMSPRPAEANQPQPAMPPVAATPQRSVVDAFGDPLPEGAVARFGTLRFRPGAYVHALVFSPDGKQLASWGYAPYKHDQFTLWDVATGKEVRSTRTSQFSLAALSWAPDGRGLAVLKHPIDIFNLEAPGDLRVWEFTASKTDPLPLPRSWPKGAPPLRRNQGDFDVAAASRDGKKLAVAVLIDGKPARIRIYELQPTESVASLKPIAEFDVPPVACKSLVFTLNGQRLLGIGPVAAGDKTKEAGMVVVWDTKTGAIVRTITTPDGAVQGGDFSIAAANDRVAVGLGSGDTFIAEIGSGAGRTIATGHKASGANQGSGVFALDFSPDGRTLSTTGPDRMVRVWDAAGTKLREFGPDWSWSQSVAFSEDGTKLASGGTGVIRLWAPNTGKEIGPIGGMLDSVRHLSISADGATALTDSGDEILRVWDTRTGSVRRQILTGGEVTGCQLTADGSKVIGAFARPEKTIRVWDSATGADITPPGFPKTIVASGFQFTSDGPVLITYSEDQLAAWSWPRGKSTAGSPMVKVWTTEMPKPAKQPGTNHVFALSISPDNRHFVTSAHRSWSWEEKGVRMSSAGDGVIDLWEIKSGKRVRRVAEEVPSSPAVYAHDGSLIITRATHATLPQANGALGVKVVADIAVVDPLTGALLRDFTPSGRGDAGPNSGAVVVLSADGKVLFRATDFGEVQAFEVATGKFRAAWPGHRDMICSLAVPASDVRRIVSGSRDTTGLVWDVGFASPTLNSLAPERRLALWGDIAETDAQKAYTAMRVLAADPAGFVTLAKEKLTPTPQAPTAAELADIMRDLGSAVFSTREAASKKLDRFGESAAPQARAHFDKEESPEVRAWLEAFLSKHGGPSLRQIRAIELLEHLGTPEAKGVLKTLATGGPSSQTADATRALERLRGRP